MENNIFKLILNDDNVNKYTKLYLILYQMNHYKKNYIPNRLIANRLNLDIPHSCRLLKMFEEKGIIRIYYIGQKRYFRFVNEIKKKEVNYEDYDWLEEEF